MKAYGLTPKKNRIEQRICIGNKKKCIIVTITNSLLYAALILKCQYG